MRTAWKGTTLRGRALLVSGVLAALAAFVLGQQDLVRVAALLLALPLVSVLVLARRDDRVSIVRELDPRQVEVGGTATVRLRLQNIGTRTGGPLLVTDLLDPALGPSPRIVVERLAPKAEVTAEYVVDGSVRGRHRIGPMALELEEPFGLIRTRRTTETTHTLIVTPVVTPLRRGVVSGATGGSGDGTARRTAAAGSDDVGTREYRPGDELRRVHWRSTARTGSLMVRQEEQPWEAQALVVLDTRAPAHGRGRSSTVADPTTSSFEWAVAAAASVAAHLSESERRVRVVAGHSEVTVTGGATAPLLDTLAIVRTHKDDVLVPSSAERASTPVVVAIIGSADPLDVAAVSALRASTGGGVAIVLDVASWEGGVVGPSHTELTAAFLASGWRAAVASRGDDIADVWDRANR